MTKAFKWNDENTQQAVEAYQTAYAEKGIEYSNSKEFLGELAETLGAKSSRAIMSKLSTMKDADGEKVYKSLESAGIVKKAPAADGKPAAQTKAHTVRAIAKALDIEAEDIFGLDRAKGEYLDNLLAAIQVLVGVEEESEF